MKQILKNPVSYILFYFIMVIITFGHAYHRTIKEEQRSFAGQPYTLHYGIGTRSIEGLFAAAMWPLYWSVQLQEPK